MVGANGFYRKQLYLEGESQCLRRGLADKCKEKITLNRYCHLLKKSQRGHHPLFVKMPLLLDLSK